MFSPRAWINKDYIRPISCDISDLKINKRKTQWVEAYEESKKYVEYCKDVSTAT